MSPAEKRDLVPPAAALRLLVANLTSNPLLKMTPGGPSLLATLATLLEWVDATEAQIDRLVECSALLERKCEELQSAINKLDGGLVTAQSLPAVLRHRLFGLLSVASREGQLEAPIADQARPGGPRPGDIVQPGGKGEAGPPIFCRRCGCAHFDPSLYDHPFEV